MVETEAYRGPDDKACHAYGGRCTYRTKTMFENGGSACVYLLWYASMDECRQQLERCALHAVLIRAIQPIDGIDTMCARREFETLNPILQMVPKLAVVRYFEIIRWRSFV
ncbi:MAG: DNA-3-methyladenine glycosylase [Saprospiraceae bacterium]|nr:DNA-3-methyladenine glycosylase [Saprospiraceae bacterium]